MDQGDPAVGVSWTGGKSLSDCTTQFLYIDAGEKSCKKKAGISSDQTSWMGSPPDQDLPCLIPVL